MKKVFVGLGGNVGNVPANFATAIKEIEKTIGAVIKRSSLYKTEPWGNKDQDEFLNQVIEIETSLKPHDILSEILLIERQMGRNREKDNQFAPRNIDIDILFYNSRIIDENNLIIPHPRLHLRNFVLAPLLEIAPELIHPVMKKTIKELSEINTDDSLVKKL